MEKKFKKIFSVITNFIAVLAMFGIAFLPLPAKKAQAAECIYNLAEFKAAQSNLTQSGTAQLSAKITVSGDVTKCGEKLKFTYYLRQNNLVVQEGYSYYDSSKTGDVFIGEQAVNITNLQAQSNFSYPLSRIGSDWKDKIPDPDDRLIFSLKVQKIVDWGTDPDILGSKPSLTINVSGISGGGAPAGGYKLNLDVQPSKGIYSPDDKKITVGFALSSTDAVKVTSDVDVQTKVGNTVVGKYKIAKADLSHKNVQDINLEGNSAFNNGANNISVTMTVAGRVDAIVGSGSISIQATGFGSPGADAGGDTGSPGADAGGGTGSPGADAGGTYNTNFSDTDRLYNPLPTGNLINMILIIGKGFLTITAVIAVAFIMIGGFQMIISRGDEETQTKAKKTITWAIIGVVIASLSFSIVAIVENLLRAGIKQI